MMVMGGIGVSIALGVAVMQVLSGPMRGAASIQAATKAEAQMAIVGKILAIDAASQTAGSDCDTDSMIEPRGFRAGPPAPTGGGLIPLESGAPTTDPWGNDYGYCVWDVGSVFDNAACGSAPRNRLNGADNPLTGSAYTQTVMALISAGPDGTFQTTCAAYVDDTTDVITTTGGSDDTHILMHRPKAARFGR